MAGGAIQANLTDILCFGDQITKEIDFLMPGCDKFGMQSCRNVYAGSIPDQSSRSLPCQWRRGDGEHGTPIAYDPRQYLSGFRVEIDVAMEVDHRIPIP
uniref:Uncharacterized protein n=1 Tax=Candidatus Kentrum sp. UNK TaxID=2126344 RepID=A0A451AWA7_9GAMM|nr:MAG: hypothetical protein BECKUNK1418G_GA0071005_102229 [Candidatus Kentron sp. UNK]VFK70308.1 MAG: hypothetical protein BECKUNK1418H_GA0071006_102627 [Candidatus Kentron sp. UNK]